MSSPAISAFPMTFISSSPGQEKQCARARTATDYLVRAIRRTRLPGAQRFECGAQFGGEDLRVFPRREVAAAIGFVEIDEIAIGAFGPAFLSADDLVRKHGDRHPHGDLVRLLRAGADQAAAG